MEVGLGGMEGEYAGGSAFPGDAIPGRGRSAYSRSTAFSDGAGGLGYPNGGGSGYLGVEFDGGSGYVGVKVGGGCHGCGGCKSLLVGLLISCASLLPVCMVCSSTARVGKERGTGVNSESIGNGECVNDNGPTVSLANPPQQSHEQNRKVQLYASFSFL